MENNERLFMLLTSIFNKIDELSGNVDYIHTRLDEIEQYVAFEVEDNTNTDNK